MNLFINTEIQGFQQWSTRDQLLVADRDVWRLNLELLPPQTSRT